MENTLWTDDFPAGSAEQSAVTKTSTNPCVKHCIHLHSADIMECVLCAHLGTVVQCQNLDIHTLKKTKTTHLFSSLRAIITRKGKLFFSLKTSVKIFSLTLKCLKTAASAIFFLYLKYKQILNSSDSKNSKNTFSEF